ncbi:hypothetical protein DFR62_2880 [Planococcus citreus]|uniref:Uncharacterized protein n=1 Tax=Planococcus citreus TaxID=1373 RepID=A0A497YDT7_9BACL|nr:hypothetical protein DFR62_2880 [Planococcus citreus]
MKKQHRLISLCCFCMMVFIFFAFFQKKVQLTHEGQQVML